MSTVRQVGIKMVVDTQSVATEVPKAAHEFDALGASAHQASERATRGLDSVGQASQSAVSGMSSLTAAAIGVAGAATVATASLAKMVVVQREFDVLNSSLITVTGSSAAAEVQFEWIKRFAATTPYALNEVTGAFVKMKALGLDASEKSLASYGNTASAMGKGLDQMIEAVADAATGEFERLKEFGIKASQQGDQVSFTFKGITTTVGNNAAEITQYLQAIGEVDFAGAMEKRAATLDGAMSNLADSASNLLLTISQSGIGDAANRETRAIANEFGLATQAIEETRAAHGGMAEQLASGAGMVAGRTFFAALNTAVNATNWAVNTLSGGLLDFSTNVDLTNWRLKSTASQVAYLESELQQAGTKMAELQQKFAVASDNIYLKSEIYQLQLYIKELRVAKAQKELLMGKDNPENYSNEGRNWKAADESAQVAAQARGRAYADLMGKMATQQEKFTAAVFDAKEKLGDLYSPEIETRLRDHYIKSASGVRTVSAAEKEAHDAAMERRKWFMVGQSEYEKQLEAERQTIERNAAAAAKAEQANIDAAQKSADAVEKRLLALKDENAAQALAAQQGVTLAQAIETITIARLSERQAALMREGDRDSEVLAIQAEIDARRKLRDELGTKAGWDAAKKEAKDLAKDSKQMAADVERELTSSLMRGFESGKGFVATLADTVENTFKTMVLRPVISAVVSPVAGAITGSLGLPGTANAAGGGTGVMGVLGNASSLYNAVTNGVSNSVTAGFSKLMSGDFGSKIGMSYYDGNAYQLTGTGQSVGAAMGYAGSAVAGYGLQKAISGGYKTGESGLVDAVTVAASAYFGPLAGAVAGVFNRAFGRKLADTGIDGSFGGEAGFTGQQYEFYKGGWFRSDKTKYSAMDAGMQSAFADQFRAQQVQTGLMAQALGQGTDAIASFTRDVKISFQGLTEAQIAEKLQEQFSISSDALASLVLGGNDFAKTGETTSQTLARLSTSLTTVNQISDTLGWSLQTVSLAGGNAASTLADKFGGLAEMTAATSSYYDAFYSEAERSATATRQLTTQLSALGVALPENEVAYRRLVDGAMASGNEQLAVDLIKLSGAYVAHRRSAADLAASVQQSAEQTERSFRSLMQNIESSVQSVSSAEAAIADIDLRSRIDAATAANEAATAMGDAAQTLRDYLQGETSTAQEQYSDVLKRAMQGEVSAMQALPGAATAANNAALATARNATEYAIARAKTLAGVSAVAELAQSRSGLVAVPQASAENEMATAVRQLTLAIQSMTDDVSSAISVDLVSKLGQIDKSGDSAIQFSELRSAFGSVASEATLSKVFRTLDINGDGQISLLEAIKGNTGSFGAVFSSFFQSFASATGQSASALQNNSALQSLAVQYATQNPGATQAQIDAAAAQMSSLSIPLPIPGVNGYLYINPFTGEIVGNTTGLHGTTGDGKAFANGGAFLNGVVTRPTAFDIGMMGEAGPEAIMPLANINGRLGIIASGGGSSPELVAAILAQNALLDRIAAAAEAGAIHGYGAARATQELVDRGVKVMPGLNPIPTVAA